MEKNNFLQPAAHFHSLRDTRPQPVTWQVIFKETGGSVHTAANYWVVVERTAEEVQHLLPAEAEQTDPPGGKPSAESAGLPF